MNTTPINIVYFGSNNFSAEVLLTLLKYKNISVKYIVTKFDKKQGRGNKVLQNPLVKIANLNKIPVIQVTSLLKNPLQLNKIDFSKIDLGVVVSFAFILPYDILCQVKKGFINLHPSLLPKYRGPSPIIPGIINNDVYLGVSTMLLNEGMDTGPILLQQKIKQNYNLIYPQIEQILINKGSKLLYKSIMDYNNGILKPIPQSNKNVSVTKYIQKQDGFVTLTENSLHIYNLYRAYYSWPGIFTKIENLEQFNGFKFKVGDKQTIIKLKQVMLNHEQKLVIKQVQLPNKPVISWSDFLNGYKV